MAAKKKSKKSAKAKKKSPAKKAKKTSKKAAKRPAKKARKSVKAAAKKAPAKKAKAAPAKKKIIGEGDYQASRAFLKDQSGFVAKNKAKIPGLGKAAEAALDGPQGDELREAEATAAARSRDNF
jgi:hypothetical protein